MITGNDLEFLNGVTFADEESRANAGKAVQAVWMAHQTAAGHSYRPPLVVIEGPAGSGKKWLAQTFQASTSVGGWARKVGDVAFRRMAKEGWPTLTIDFPEELQKAELARLKRFVAAQDWRIGAGPESAYQKLRCVTFLLTYKAPEGIADKIVIRLNQRSSTAVIKAAKDMPKFMAPSPLQILLWMTAQGDVFLFGPREEGEGFTVMVEQGSLNDRYKKELCRGAGTAGEAFAEAMRGLTKETCHFQQWRAEVKRLGEAWRWWSFALEDGASWSWQELYDKGLTPLQAWNAEWTLQRK